MQLNNPELLRQANLIDGEWIKTKEMLDVFNPSTGKKIGAVPILSASQIKKVILKAGSAWEEYRTLTAKERADLLFRFRKQIMIHQEDLAMIIHNEQGKPISQARKEIISSANTIEWFAEEVKRIYGETIPEYVANKRLMTIKQPVGVVMAITPWNFPSSIVTRKCAPALAAGCTIIIKPSPETPFSALALAYLAEKAGFPSGVVNVITGDASEIGQIACHDKTVRMLSFTGSTEVGKLLLRESASTIKKTTMELGGNAPFIVFNDADIDKAIQGAIESKFRNSGQTCVCANRFFVQDQIYNTFIDRFKAVVSSLKLTINDNQDADIGPLIRLDAIEKASNLVQDAVEKGAKIITGGRVVDRFFFEPTILVDVNDQMTLSHTELFAPVAPIFKFSSEKEVIKMANDTDYGLAGYFYSKDISRIYRVAEALELGMVGINTGSVSTEVAPFGGVKFSGLGREGSKYGIDEYVELKYLCLDVS